MTRVFVPPLHEAPRQPIGAEFAFSGASMGTSWNVRGYCDIDTERTRSDIEGLLNEIIREMSQWEPHSFLSQFNAAPAGATFDTPTHFHKVLTCALDLAAQTDGAFDPTLGALVDLWGFGPAAAGNFPPDEGALRTAHAASGRRKLSYDANARRLTQPGGLKLDFAGIAKGYAVDAVAQVLRAAGSTSFLVEIGGELSGLGVKLNGQPWWVEIERPSGFEGDALLAALYNLSVATSGDYRRFTERGGARISHTIDPRTGAPASNGLASVTVLHAECMRADAYATALMALGPESGRAFADAHGMMALFTVRTETADLEEHFSRAFAEHL